MSACWRAQRCWSGSRAFSSAALKITGEFHCILTPPSPRTHPSDRLPVICEKAHTRGASTTPELDKSRFLVPSDLTLGQLVFVIRRRLALPPGDALFLYIGGVLPPTNLLMREVYSLHREPDGFLYIQYSGEAAFGGLSVQ